MVWVVGAIAVFLFLAWVGKQSRLGKIGVGPWIHQFRTLRSVIGMGFLVLGVTMLMRGLVWQGLAAFLVSFVLSGSVRYQAHFRQPQEPAADASYSPEEIKAYNTLELAIGADRKAIKDAWKRLMKAAHPDQGGDAARASALNAARDVLLKHRR
jgi:hypothetical protein